MQTISYSLLNISIYDIPEETPKTTVKIELINFTLNYLFCSFFFLFFFLKSFHLCERQLQRQEDRQTEIFHLLDSLPKYPLDHTKARNPEFVSGLLRGCSGPSTAATLHCFPRSIRSELIRSRAAKLRNSTHKRCQLHM